MHAAAKAAFEDMEQQEIERIQQLLGLSLAGGKRIR
jgi:hypothetical protein